MSKALDGEAFQSLVADRASSMSKVSVKAVGSQLVLMTIISVSQVLCTSAPSSCQLTVQIGTLLAFSFFRPREKKVYAPKVSLLSLSRPHT